ncbi:MAG: DUF5685 family protein [Firmicutes bacterium]|nr:DUF5685 family protein [Bacillota bacterium]
MLGYVQIYKPDLKVREYETYMGYYCGICKYIGKKYGQLPRMSLSYDAAFLAIALASVVDSPDEPVQEHCIVHHIKKKTVIRNSFIEYAGDVMLILAWHKLADDARDDNSLPAKSTMVLLKHHYRKLQKKYPELCRNIAIGLSRLSKLEKEKCASLDRTAEAFAKIMEVIFVGGSPDFHETFAKAGYHLGKWVYLADAVDDIEKDIKSGAYNPLIYRFEYSPGEDPKQFRNRITPNLEFNLYQYLSVIADAFNSLDIKKNKGIIDNIIYFGLNKKTEDIIKGEIE